MREIKFRGKRVDTGEWVYGSNIHKVILNDTKEELWVIHPKGEPIEHLGDGYIKYRPPVVITESIGQYTGLFDKNGKEIFEGDIVEKTYYSYHQPECSEIFKIIYNGYGLGFNFEHIKGRSYHTPFTEEIEVIGNIHENPELLDKKQWKKGEQMEHYKLNDFEQSKEKTKYIKFECISCKKQVVLTDRLKDGHRCRFCGNPMKAVGYVRRSK